MPFFFYNIVKRGMGDKVAKKFTKRQERIFARLYYIQRFAPCDTVPLDYQLRQMGYINMNERRVSGLTGRGIRALYKLMELSIGEREEGLYSKYER